MVKSHEEQYWLKNLSLFTVKCGHHCGQKNKKYGENWLLWFIPMSKEYCIIIFVFRLFRKIENIDIFWSSL